MRFPKSEDTEKEKKTIIIYFHHLTVVYTKHWKYKKILRTLLNSNSILLREIQGISDHYARLPDWYGETMENIDFS